MPQGLCFLGQQPHAQPASVSLVDSKSYGGCCVLISPAHRVLISSPDPDSRAQRPSQTLVRGKGAERLAVGAPKALPGPRCHGGVGLRGDRPPGPQALGRTSLTRTVAGSLGLPCKLPGAPGAGCIWGTDGLPGWPGEWAGTGPDTHGPRPFLHS